VNRVNTAQKTIVQTIRTQRVVAFAFGIGIMILGAVQAIRESVIRDSVFYLISGSLGALIGASIIYISI
jgi:hypothetical protein